MLNIVGNLTFDKQPASGDVYFYQSRNSKVHVAGDLNWTHRAGNNYSRYRLSNNTNSLTVGGNMSMQLLAGSSATDNMDVDCLGGSVAVTGNALWRHAAAGAYTVTLKNGMSFDIGGTLTFDHTGGAAQLLDINNTNTLLYVHGNVLMNDGAGGATATTWRMDNASRARVLGNLTMTATAGAQIMLDMNNTSYLWLKGSLVRSAAPNHFGSLSGSSNSTIEFNGTANTQLITDDGGNGGDYFHYEKVVINNTFGTYPQLTTEGTTTIWNDIQFQNGVLGTAATRKLVIADNSTSNGGTASSFVDGPMKKVGNDLYTFPVGKNGYWARLAMSGLAAFNVTTEFDCEYYASASPNNTAPYWNAGINHMSYVEYWNLTRTLDPGNDANCQVRLYWESATRSAITSNADLRVGAYRASNSKWNNQGGTGAGGAAGSIPSTTAFTEFGNVSFGSGGGVNPLPVELLGFTAHVVSGQVQLDWSTASEHNNDHFDVERSRDGIVFEEVASVPGAVNSTSMLYYQAIDHAPWPSVSYYRLKQVDTDGTFEYSNTEVINMTSIGPNVPNVFPNPGSGNVMVVSNNALEGPQLFKVLDLSGRVVLAETHTSLPGEVVQLSTAALPAGSYFISVEAEGAQPASVRWIKN